MSDTKPLTAEERAEFRRLLNHQGNPDLIECARNFAIVHAHALLASADRDANGHGLTFAAFRAANRSRCVRWHPEGIASWSPSDWLTAVTGELGELASLLKMRNRERDRLPGNKFSPTDRQIADELADVVTYLDLLAEVLGVDLGQAVARKFNEVSERVGFPERIPVSTEPLTREAGHG